MSAMKNLATAEAPLNGTHAWRDDVRVNRIRYPRPNRLGLQARTLAFLSTVQGDEGYHLT